MHPSCSTQIEIISYGVFLPAMVAPSLIVSIAFLYFYVSAHYKNEMKTSNTLWYLGIAFLLANTLCALGSIIRNEAFCHHHALSNLGASLNFGFYAAQALLLLTTLFMRLVFIFKDSELKVSKCTIYVYVAYTIFAVIIGIVHTILFVTGQALGIATGLLALAFLLYLCTLFWLNYLFIVKLLKVYESCKDTVAKNDGLQHIATKNAVLCVVCSVTILLTVIFMIMYTNAPSIGTELLVCFVGQFDLITNMLSVLLGYRRFDTWYLRLCGCCHRGCGSCCLCCAESKNKEIKMMTQEVQSASSGDESTAQTEL